MFLILPAEASAASTEESLKRVNALRYGPNFVYDEFMVTSNKLSGFIISVILVAVMTLARSSAIVRRQSQLHLWPNYSSLYQFRWLMKKVVPAPGEGPSEECVISSASHTGFTNLMHMPIS